MRKPALGSLKSIRSKCQGYVGHTGSAMPTRKVVTTEPNASKTTVAATVKMAQPWSRWCGSVGLVLVVTITIPLQFHFRRARSAKQGRVRRALALRFGLGGHSMCRRRLAHAGGEHL